MSCDFADVWEEETQTPDPFIQRLRHQSLLPSAARVLLTDMTNLGSETVEKKSLAQGHNYYEYMLHASQY